MKVTQSHKGLTVLIHSIDIVLIFTLLLPDFLLGQSPDHLALELCVGHPVAVGVLLLVGQSALKELIFVVLIELIFTAGRTEIVVVILTAKVDAAHCADEAVIVVVVPVAEAALLVLLVGVVVGEVLLGVGVLVVVGVGAAAAPLGL